MPELPELEAIRQYLISNLVNDVIVEVKTSNHTVIRSPTKDQFENMLTGSLLTKIDRIGKILCFSLQKDDLTLNLFVDHGLTGRLGWISEYKKLPIKTVFLLSFKSGKTLIYHDRKLHGAIWLFNVLANQNDEKPDVIDKFGPDPLSISLNDFLSRIQKFRGEIKGILTNQSFVTGIGNAYADEILFRAKTHPYTKRTHLSKQELEILFSASKDILSGALSQILNILNTNDKIDNENFWRERIMKIHLRGGQPCPSCGHKISDIKAIRVTSFCRKCQISKNKNFI